MFPNCETGVRAAIQAMTRLMVWQTLPKPEYFDIDFQSAGVLFLYIRIAPGLCHRWRCRGNNVLGLEKQFTCTMSSDCERGSKNTLKH